MTIDIPQAEEVPENAGVEGEFQNGRQRVEDREAHDRLDALRTPFDDARQAARAALQVKAQRQRVHVDERLVGQLADRILPDAGKQGVAQLRETPHDEARHVVGDDHHDGGHQHHGNPEHVRLQPVQRVGGVFEEERDDRGNQLGDNQKESRPENAGFQVRPLGGPEVWPQAADGRDGGSVAGGRVGVFIGQEGSFVK